MVSETVCCTYSFSLSQASDEFKLVEYWGHHCAKGGDTGPFAGAVDAASAGSTSVTWWHVVSCFDPEFRERRLCGPLPK